jgi:hypothetical protein
MNEKLKRFLKKIQITTVAAVGNPAHQHPGWAVIKSTDIDGMVRDVVRNSVREAVTNATTDRTAELRELVEANGQAITDLEEHTIAAIEDENELRAKVARLSDDTHALCRFVGLEVPA